MTIVRQVLTFPYDTVIFTEAAECLQRGGLVAFPTETVYGLGALALDASAVARIFSAKGRPLSDPLIVHIAERKQATELVSDFPRLANRLAAEFWPGPLTLVLPKSEAVPSIVTAGGPTVALRIPADERALSLLRAVGAPLAAPSANRFGRISPTRAEHVLAELGGRIDMLLDGGPTGHGLESTVLDVTIEPARILRPGAVTLEQLRRIDPYIRLLSEMGGADGAEAIRSPGQLPTHYAPQVPLWLASGPRATELLAAECQRRQEAGQRVGWLCLEEDAGPAASADVSALLGSGGDAAACARHLYHALRELDDRGVCVILAREIPDRGLGRAINDRLRRAAQGRSLPG